MLYDQNSFHMEGPKLACAQRKIISNLAKPPTIFYFTFQGLDLWSITSPPHPKRSFFSFIFFPSKTATNLCFTCISPYENLCCCFHPCLAPQSVFYDFNNFHLMFFALGTGQLSLPVWCHMSHWICLIEEHHCTSTSHAQQYCVTKRHVVWLLTQSHMYFMNAHSAQAPVSNSF